MYLSLRFLKNKNVEAIIVIMIVIIETVIRIGQRYGIGFLGGFSFSSG